MLALTDGDSSPGSRSSERFDLVEAIEELLFLRIIGTLFGGVCGRSGSSSYGLISGHAAAGSVASGLVVRDDLRTSFGEEVTESKWREARLLSDEKDATLLRRLGTSTLLT